MRIHCLMLGGSDLTGGNEANWVKNGTGEASLHSYLIKWRNVKAAEMKRRSALRGGLGLVGNQQMMTKDQKTGAQSTWFA